MQYQKKHDIVVANNKKRLEQTNQKTERVNTMASKIYDMITERVVNKLNEAIKKAEQGEQVLAPWNRPWKNTGLPQNLVSKKPYRGINAFLLSMMGFSSPYYVTFNQSKKLGGQVKKGEKSIPVIFWKWILVEKDEQGKKLDEPKKIPLLKYYNVFNIEQCENLEDKIPQVEKIEFNPIQDAEQIILEMPKQPRIEHKSGRACYYPSKDEINMPEKGVFNGEHEYYATLFHELIHATGHTTRLNRTEVMDNTQFGSHAYSTEELVAEMGAMFLCNDTGINTTFENSLAYLKSWLGKLKDDTKMLIVAGGKAQKAVDYIRNAKFDYDKKQE